MNLANKCKFAKRKKLFFARWFYTIYEQKFSNLRPLLSITFAQGFRISKKFGHWTLGSGGKRALKRSEQMKKNPSKTFTLSDFFLLHLFTSFKRLLSPTSQNQMSKLFRYSESLSKSNGKKWSQIWKLLLIKGVKSPRKKSFIWWICICWPSSPSVLDKFNKCMP